MSQSDTIIYPASEWNANDYSNLITISAAAISSVLLVIFKSRCKNINLCCGLVNCLRDPKDDEPEEEPPAEGEGEAVVPPAAAQP